MESTSRVGQDDFVVFTYSRCWEEWEVTIYDYWGKEIWLSFNPSDKWSGLTSKNDYVEAGTYLIVDKGQNTWYDEANRHSYRNRNLLRPPELIVFLPQIT